jgi:hypothetical protein
MYVEAFELGAAFIKEGSQIWALLARLRNRIKHGHLRIAIFGAGGTGKSTLGHLFSGQLTADACPQPYRESLTSETFKLKGDIVCTFVAPPGQVSRIGHDWHELYRSLASGESSGVINVVAAGYHSFSHLSLKEHRLYQEGMSEADFMRLYRQDRQSNELKLLQEIIPHLKSAKGSVWVVTLVNKQDLWWPERAAVRAHYMEGAYNRLMETVLEHKGRQHFRHDYLSASLVLSNFRTDAGETLALTAEGYDHTIRLGNLNHFLRTIEALAVS